MKLKKKKKNSFPCDLSIGRSVWTELKALFHLPPNAFHGRGIARMKFSSGKLNVASRWKGPEGKHERAGRIVTGSKQNPVSRSKKERKNEKGKRERGRNWHGYIHIYISSDKQRKRVDSFTPKELFKRIVGGMRASFFQIRPERDTSYTFARYAYEIRTRDTYIYIHIVENLTHVYKSFESNYYTYNYYTGRCFRGNRLRNSKKYVVILIDKNFEFLQRYLYICFT